MQTEQQIQKKVNIVMDAKQRSYKFAIVTLIVIFVLIIGAIQPTVVTITRILSEIEAKQNMSAMLQTKIDALSSLAKDFNTNAKAFENMKFYFPNRGDFSLIMANIDEIAKKNNFTLQNIGFDSADVNLATSSEAYTALTPWKAVVSVNGRRENLINFLKDMESLPNFPMMDSISFSNTVDENGEMMFSISFRIYKIDDQDFYMSNSEK